MKILEAEVERLKLEEGTRKTEGEEYQTHLEEELAESQAQRAALLEEGASNSARSEVPEHFSCRDYLCFPRSMEPICQIPLRCGGEARA